MVAVLFTLCAQSRTAFRRVTCFIQMLMCCSCFCLLPLSSKHNTRPPLYQAKHQSHYPSSVPSFLLFR